MSIVQKNKCRVGKVVLTVVVGSDMIRLSPFGLQTPGGDAAYQKQFESIAVSSDVSEPKRPRELVIPVAVFV